MASFDFVTDEDLRASLEADAAEMAACMERQGVQSRDRASRKESTGYKDPPELAKWIGEQRLSMVNWFDALPS